LVEVPIEKIASNSYSLNYAEYMNDDAEEEHYEDGVVVKTLGEVCEIQNGKRIVKGQVETGEYPVLGGGGFTSFYTNEYSREGKTCKISREGMSLHNCVMLLNEKYYLNSQAFTIKSKNESIMINEYLWYYLDNNKEQVFKCGRGTAQKAIDIDEFKSIKIPIPSLERQQEVVKYLDFIYEKANKTSITKIAELKQLNEFCLNNQKLFGENVVKTLGEVCKVNQGTYIKPDMKIEGQYPVYGGGNVSYYINQYNREDDIIVAKDGVSADCVRYEKNKFFLNHHGWTLICKEQIIKKYMFYYLQSIQPELLSIAKGTAQLGINQDNFYKIKIPIPSLERQQEIVTYCESNDALIRQLEMEIENNKKQAQLFIDGVVKSHVQILTDSSEEETIATQEHQDEVNTGVSPVSSSSSSAMSIAESGTEPKPKTRKFIVKKSIP
jgi:type I restriction enzyme S subunit